MGGFAFSTAACGVTPQAAVENAKMPIALSYAPGHMFITDFTYSDFTDFLEAQKKRSIFSF